jgi:hypothetical protein
MFLELFIKAEYMLFGIAYSIDSPFVYFLNYDFICKKGAREYTTLLEPEDSTERTREKALSTMAKARHLAKEA